MLSMKRSRKKQNSFPLHVKTGDTVLVLAGKSKGLTGIVRKVFLDRGKLVVEGANMIKKTTRPNPMAGSRGGIIDMEAPLAASNVMLFCLQCNKPTRIQHEVLSDGRKTRVCKHCKAQFDA
jgi:large subunit ribosomal protein L24